MIVFQWTGSVDDVDVQRIYPLSPSDPPGKLVLSQVDEVWYRSIVGQGTGKCHCWSKEESAEREEREWWSSPLINLLNSARAFLSCTVLCRQVPALGNWSSSDCIVADISFCSYIFLLSIAHVCQDIQLVYDDDVLFWGTTYGLRALPGT